MKHNELDSQDAVIAVDVQNDFCPGGALAVQRGDEVVPELNRWIEAAQAKGATVVASRDWHPANHMSFKDRGGPWPVHCVQETPGAAFHPQLRLPQNAIIITKGSDPEREQYSAFDDTGLADQLKERGIRRVWVGGLAQDVCVRATVLDAAKAGFEVHVLCNATRPVDAAGGERAFREMETAGAVLEQGAAHA